MLPNLTVWEFFIMQKIIPARLQKGDEIRVIAPATGLKIIGQDCRQIAKERFEAMGLKVSFATNTTDENFDMFASTDIKKRADDVMEAFGDKNVKAIFTILGGFNSNQILPFLDYDVIKNNPKILCGYSDITALHGAIRAKTGLVTFYGPHYSSVGMKKGNEYTILFLFFRIHISRNRTNFIRINILCCKNFIRHLTKQRVNNRSDRNHKNHTANTKQLTANSNSNKDHSPHPVGRREHALTKLSQ